MASLHNFSLLVSSWAEWIGWGSWGTPTSCLDVDESSWVQNVRGELLDQWLSYQLSLLPALSLEISVLEGLTGNIFSSLTFESITL